MGGSDNRIERSKFKASELRYKIVRYPGADVVAEACAETQFTDNNVPHNEVGIL